MQRSKKERRIDFSKEEMAEVCNVSESTFDDRVKKVCEIHKIEKSKFKRDGERYNFYPPEYAPLLQIIIRNYDKNPLTKRSQKDVNVDNIKEYNNTMLHDIENMPEPLKEIIMNCPWFETSKKVTEWIDLLVEEVVQFIFNVTTSYNGDIGETIKFLCRQLDKINYQLYRGEQIKKNLEINNISDEYEVYKDIKKEIDEMEELEKEELFNESPYLEFMLNTDKDNNYNTISRNNLSIDKGIVEIMKILIRKININSIQENIGELGEYLCDEERKKLKNNYPNYTEKLLDEKERNLYYEENENDLLDFFQNISSTPGHMRAIVNNSRQWEPILSRIVDETFKENYLAEAKGQMFINNLTAEEYANMMYKLTNEEFVEITKGYVNNYNKIKSQEKQMNDIVSKFLGQVLLQYLD